MEIQSKDFGVIDIGEEEIIHFPDGVFSFAEEKDFVFIKSDEYAAIWMQSIRGADPRFILFNPLDIVGDYQPLLPKGFLAELKADSIEALCFFVIAVIPPDIRDMTVNLKSPVVVNPEKRLAKQVILENENYSVRHRIEGEKGGDGC